MSFTAYQEQGLQRSPLDKPCGTNTCYQSVTVARTAQELNDPAAKTAALAAIVAKYNPELTNKTLSAAAVAKTAVIELIPSAITGKYYR